MSKTPRFPPTPRRIGFFLFPGFQVLDAAGPIAAFEVASRFAPGAYELKVAALEGGLIPASAPCTAMPATPLSRLRTIDTLIVVGGNGTREAMANAKLLGAIKRASARARRTASVCSGAFILAAAGLLDGKRATTHWRRAPDLARHFPNVRVDADCIHVQDGDVWTSAGVSAGIDLALALIEEDLGAEIAESAAREMVVYAKRPGGQTQHSALLDLDAPRFSGAQRLDARIGENLSVERLARAP